jgi:transcriptional regulator with XRE-family HTH domain
MTPTQAKKLGAFVRRAREEAGLSQNKLGELVGVPNSTILRLERGENLMPRPDLLSSVAEALDLNLADVYGLAGYAVPGELPALQPYLRSKYSDLPDEAADAIAAYAQRLARRHGVDLSGPAPGEDEEPETTPKTRRKGGTRR